MPNKFFISSILFASFFLIGNAHAQNCTTPFEMVTELRHPDPGSYTVWDTLYGEEEKDEGFVSIINKGDEVLAVGEVRRLHGVHPSMVFVQFDRRGRKVWDRFYSISGLRNIVKMLPDGDGYIVVSNNHKFNFGSFVWLGFFDKSGELKSQKSITDKKRNLFANDIIKSADGKGWVVAVTSEEEFEHKKSKTKHRNAAVYLLDKNGNVKFNRSYVLGINNEIIGLSVAEFTGEKSAYIATGYFENVNGKKIGWVSRLERNLSYLWQKEFSRGDSAIVKLSADSKDDNIFVLGEVKSKDFGLGAGWLMSLNGDSGKLQWQRFYYGDTGHHNYEAKGLYVDGGLASVMMMANSTKPTPNEEVGSEAIGMPDFMSYAHVLTLNKRGITLDGDSYYMGVGVSISQLIKGDDGRRVMAGFAVVPSDGALKAESIKNLDVVPLKEEGDIHLPDIELSDKAKDGLAMLKNNVNSHGKSEAIHDSKSAKGAAKVRSFTRDGWIVIGNIPDLYKDPCVRGSNN